MANVKSYLSMASLFIMTSSVDEAKFRHMKATVRGSMPDRRARRLGDAEWAGDTTGGFGGVGGGDVSDMSDFEGMTDWRGGGVLNNGEEYTDWN